MAKTNSSLAGRRVLLVEDEYFIVDEALARSFEASGAEVVGPTASVDGALHLIAGAERLDGAVLDINLRGDMAFPVADALLARGVPFVFATGYDAATIPARYAHVPCCEKPFDAETIRRALFA